MDLVSLKWLLKQCIYEKKIYKRRGIFHALIDAFKCINTLLIFGIGRTRLDKSPPNPTPYMAVSHIQPWQLLLSPHWKQFFCISVYFKHTIPIIGISSVSAY